MKTRCTALLLICGFSSASRIEAQTADPVLVREVAAVRAELARSRLGLRQYTWTEQTEVFVKGELKSSSAAKCRYDAAGELTRTPMDVGKQMEVASGVSKRPRVRGKADMQDYIERAISRIYRYVPPKPEQIDYLVQNGYASRGASEAGKSEVRLTNYFQDGDSLVFLYDSASKAVLQVNVASTLGSPKDPVTLEAIFETLPDGVTHLRSAILNATAKKVQVKIKNLVYQKLAS